MGTEHAKRNAFLWMVTAANVSCAYNSKAGPPLRRGNVGRGGWEFHGGRPLAGSSTCFGAFQRWGRHILKIVSGGFLLCSTRDSRNKVQKGPPSRIRFSLPMPYRRAPGDGSGQACGGRLCGWRTRPGQSVLPAKSAGPHRASQNNVQEMDGGQLAPGGAALCEREYEGTVREMSETYAWSSQSRSVNSRAAIP